MQNGPKSSEAGDPTAIDGMSDEDFMRFLTDAGVDVAKLERDVQQIVEKAKTPPK